MKRTEECTMTGSKNGSGKEERAGNVEQLTDEKLDKVSGGMHVCVICRPHKKPKGVEDDPKAQPLCRPQLEGPEPRPCLPRGY
jgi:hypothetical protein